MSGKPVRRSQAISPFGVGAMVDFPRTLSLIHAGLDAWPFNEHNPEHNEFKILDENRLASRLGVSYFVQPPDFRLPPRFGNVKIKNPNLKLPFLRFPLWHSCPRCGLMYESAYHDQMAPKCTGPVGSGKEKGKPHKPRFTVQLRFVAACSAGHLQDFPWKEWIFKRPDPPVEGKLRLITTGSATLAGVKVTCERHVARADGTFDIEEMESRSLAGAFKFEVGQKSPLTDIKVLCTGSNPALGIPSPTTPAMECGRHLYPLLRGGSNVYFPHIVSAIYLPPIDLKVDVNILEVLDNPYLGVYLKMSNTKTVTSEDAKRLRDQFCPSSNVDPEKLAEELNKKLDPLAMPIMSNPDLDLREEEYAVFGKDLREGYPKTNLLIRSQPIASYENVVKDSFERVSLVHKLRETRAFVGFSRMFSDDELDDESRRALMSRVPQKWLPASIVRGEGIFLKFRDDRLERWETENRAILDKRLIAIRRNLHATRIRRHQQNREMPARFVLLHTLSHLLINELIYECGYGSASLRERIYCQTGENPMAGLLIYTAAGDSEGSMGGLVRMGVPGRLEKVLSRALEKANWCSTDPVCGESTGQGPDNCNLAACHSCALLPETSCEEQNRLLDRGTVIGTPDQKELGFFQTY